MWNWQHPTICSCLDLTFQFENPKIKVGRSTHLRRYYKENKPTNETTRQFVAVSFFNFQFTISNLKIPSSSQLCQCPYFQLSDQNLINNSNLQLFQVSCFSVLRLNIANRKLKISDNFQVVQFTICRLEIDNTQHLAAFPNVYFQFPDWKLKILSKLHLLHFALSKFWFVKCYSDVVL